MENPNLIDIRKLIASKNKSLSNLLPGFIINYLRKIVHVRELNEFILKHGDKKGLDFIEAGLQNFNVTLKCEGIENVPNNGRFIFAANHPLGGFDGVMLIKILHGIFGDHINVLVNDLLMNLKNMDQYFIPINKHGKQATKAIDILNETFESSNQLITFPAGLVSRRIKGTIVDLEWKKNFITRSVRHKRDVIPVFFSGQNSDFFYNLAKLRKLLGIKVNIEMLYLVDELFKHRDKTFTARIGKSIPYQTFDKSKSHQEWAFFVKQKSYELNNQEVYF